MRKRIWNIANRIWNWIKVNRRETVLLLIILSIGAFCRLYKISEYMTFLGDEGRDAIIIRRLLVDFDPILIGPRTSIGDMYLGPLYYYLTAPSLLLANFSPVGPSIFVALTGVATVFLIWFITGRWFSSSFVKKGLSHKTHSFALIVAGLYAISPIIIDYSRSSWNPNIMPFFALLTIYSVWKWWEENESKWIFITFVSISFVLQSHYLGLLMLPTLGVFWMIKFVAIRKRREERRKFIFFSLISFILFLMLMSPLVIFDARHGWNNFASLKRFFLERQTTISAKPWTAIPKMHSMFNQFVTRIVVGKNLLAGKYLTYFYEISAALILINFCKRKFSIRENRALFLIFIWLGFAFLGLGLYKQHIYDHYFGFIYPAPFLLMGYILQKLDRNFGLDGRILSVFIILMLVALNLLNNPLRFEPNFQMQRAKEVAEYIAKESGGEKYNLAVIAERNYEDGYQYFLEKENQPVYDIDPLRLSESVAENLFVICEMPVEKCDPTHSPKAEIANFGWSKIENSWGVSGVTIFKLVHTD